MVKILVSRMKDLSVKEYLGIQRAMKISVEEDSRRGLQKRACLGLGVATRSRVLVLVFVNWNLYKKNLCGFSSQRVRGFGLGS